jgi:hypothetical protein
MNVFWGSECGDGIFFENDNAEMFAVKVDIVNDRRGIHLMVSNEFSDLLTKWITFLEREKRNNRHINLFDPNFEG